MDIHSSCDSPVCEGQISITATNPCEVVMKKDNTVAQASTAETSLTRFPNDAKTLAVPEAGRVYFDLGRNASYDAAKRGEIPVIKIGGRLRVPVVCLERMLDEASTPKTRSVPEATVGNDLRAPSPAEAHAPRSTNASARTTDIRRDQDHTVAIHVGHRR
jgi:hypothetical protein